MTVDPFIVAFGWPSKVAVPVVADDADLKLPLLLREDAEFDIPHKEIRYGVQRVGTYAFPYALVKKRVVNPVGYVKWKGLVADLTPFVMIMNGAATTTTEQFKCTQHASGLPKKMVAHVQQGEFKDGRQWDYSDCYAEEVKFFEDQKMLGAEILARAGTVTAGNAFTVTPSALGGSQSLKEGYPLNDPNNTVTWNSKNLGSFLRSISFSIKAKLDFHEIQGSTALFFQNYREIEYSPIAMKFVLLGDAVNDLDDIEALIDASTSSNLVITLCRSAADYLKLTFGGVHVEKWKAYPFNSKKIEGTYIDALFSVPVKTQIDTVQTPLEVREKQATTNVAADYEL